MGKGIPFYHGGLRSHMADTDMEASMEISPDPFSEEEIPTSRMDHTRPHNRKTKISGENHFKMKHCGDIQQ